MVFLLCTCTSTPLRALGINASSGGRAHANATLSNPPANDDLANAIVLTITDGSHTLSGTEAAAATLETNETNCGSVNSWWYAFTPQITTEFLLLATSAAFPGPTVLSAERSTPINLASERS